MNFRISDTFTDSLARLTGEEQKAVKMTAFDLQLDPANPGMRFHKLDQSKDKNFWSVRVSGDLRLIVHRTAGSLMLCYVGHHDKAYAWAERRRLETHPTTGAAQLVEVRERVEEIVVPKYVEVVAARTPKERIFEGETDDTLLSCGVPPEWVDAVRQATEDSLLELAEHLPREAAEALLDLATGVRPRVEVPAPAVPDPFEHPDSLRRFRVVANVEELERALDFPWEKWTVFLHPAQRDAVERDYGGPARVSGSAGTGKTIVALHRAVFLARSNPNARVLLTTFSETLANALRVKLRRLIDNEPRIAERLEVLAIDVIARRLHESNFGPVRIASAEEVRQLVAAEAAEVPGLKFTSQFLLGEWRDVIDAWQLDSWEAYRDVARLGRKTRLPEKSRAALWEVFEGVREALQAKALTTPAAMFTRLAGHFGAVDRPAFEFAVVDEAQDLSPAQLRFLASLGSGRPNGLFFAGDLGQRIFQQPFSWKALNVDIRGRSRNLRINYRTSHQIRVAADRLLGPEIADVDGNVEDRRGAISVFNGAEPTVLEHRTAEAEVGGVAEWLKTRRADGVLAHEIGVFVRSEAELHRAHAAVTAAGLASRVLDDSVEPASGFVSVSTMHLAKGLEFRAVAVIACDDEILPLQSRIAAVADDADLEEIYNTERHLLYVACTRARDFLLVSGVTPISEFVDDMQSR